MKTSPADFAAVLLTLVVLLSGETRAQNALPPFIKQRCSASDPEFNTCITGVTRSVAKQFAKGIKELDIPSIDPVTLNKINIDVPGLKITFSNVTLLGLSGVRVDDLKKNLVTKKAVFDFAANLIMKGHYKMDGRVVVLPIQGDGDFVIHLTNMSFHLRYKFDTVKGSGGKDYWQVTSYKQTYKLDRATFDLKNLYNGNEFLAETTLKFINENWELIMNDIAPAAVEQICDTCVRATNKFFSKVPIEELVLP